MTDRITPRGPNGASNTVNILSICSYKWARTSPLHHDHTSSLYAGSHPSPTNTIGNKMNTEVLDDLHQVGFTIIELLIAIAIVGILATIAVPNVLTEVPKFRLHGATQQVLGDLMTGRMKAVSHNKKVKVFFISDTLYKICDDANDDGTVDNCEGDAKTINIQDNYKGVTLGSNNNPIFSPRGTASNLATISITNSSGTKSITIAITGRLQIN